jgi:hypothetical protein
MLFCFGWYGCLLCQRQNAEAQWFTEACRMEMGVRIMLTALLAPSQIVLRMNMQYQKAALPPHMNKQLWLPTNYSQSLNSASIAGVIISLDTGWLTE